LSLSALVEGGGTKHSGNVIAHCGQRPAGWRGRRRTETGGGRAEDGDIMMKGEEEEK